ncbi:glutathione peroxidase [Limnoglobus roseus]|uniref:Glutathione peroxidase n=1 Tax=Limnoglobus roseus TaxID=2598579 RepID=A0A5C1ALJ3_9BACT|nr:glutathione peroxidase [Limnoglobus roseus]
MRFLLLAALLLFPVSLIPADDTKKGGDKVNGPLDFKMKDINGKEVDLAAYKGKVVLFVNVASKCGYTPQYKGLEAVYQRYEKEGLMVIGVPANEFGGQEPGTDAEIKEFCTAKYNVTFPMLSKVVVKGDGITPLYKYLTSKETDGKYAGDIKWNFEKFLVNRKGEVVGRYDSKVKPESDELTKAITTELAKK